MASILHADHSTVNTADRAYQLPEPTSVVNQIRQALHILTQGDSDRIFEIRLTDPNPLNLFYTDFDKAAERIAAIDAFTPPALATYITLNPRQQDWMNLNTGKGTRGHGANKQDVAGYTWIPIDIDAGQPTDSSSTDEEKQHAWHLVERVRQFLEQEHHWPTPIVADSGNGYHLLYALEFLPTNRECNAVSRALRVIADACNPTDNPAHVDTRVGDPNRIFKLYGTVARKGVSTPERPHRRASILNCPDAVDEVSHEQLLELSTGELADEIVVDDLGNELPNILRRRGEELLAPLLELLADARPKGDHWELKCHTHPDHRDKRPASIQIKPDAIVYHCMGDKCAGKNLTDLLNAVAPGWGANPQLNAITEFPSILDPALDALNGFNDEPIFDADGTRYDEPPKNAPRATKTAQSSEPAPVKQHNGRPLRQLGKREAM